MKSLFVTLSLPPQHVCMDVCTFVIDKAPKKWTQSNKWDHKTYPYEVRNGGVEGWGERMWKWQKLKGNYLSQIKHQRFPFSSITVRASEWMNEPQNEERNRRTNEYKSIKISQLQYMRCLRERERARVCEGLWIRSSLYFIFRQNFANIKYYEYCQCQKGFVFSCNTSVGLSWHRNKNLSLSLSRLKNGMNETNEFLSENLPLHSVDIDFIFILFIYFLLLLFKY